jgi:tetratricopeptide (TPR) repeat protein
VLQLHLHPSGKPEAVLPSVGFYFTERAPTNSCFPLKLCRYTIDIPPGNKDYRIEDSYVLPEARNEFEAVLRANPLDYKAQGSLGFICLPQRRYSEAEAFFEKALEINPEDTVAQANLKALRQGRAGAP